MLYIIKEVILWGCVPFGQTKELFTFPPRFCVLSCSRIFVALEKFTIFFLSRFHVERKNVTNNTHGKGHGPSLVERFQ